MLGKKSVICLFYIWSATFNLALAEQHKASEYVKRLSETAIAVIKNPLIDDNEKEERLTNIFVDNVDIDWIARFSLGRYYRAASEQELAEYHELYRRFLPKIYIPSFKKYNKEEVVIINVMQRKEGEYFVKTQIVRGDKANLNVNYRVIEEEDGSLKIIDIISEGVSLISTQRSELTSIISRKDMRFLIDRLKEKL